MLSPGSCGSGCRPGPLLCVCRGTEPGGRLWRPTAGGPSLELCGLVGRIDFRETVECMAPSSEPAAGRDSPCPSQFLTLFSGAHPIRPGPPRAPCLSESSQGPHESELPPLLPRPASQAHEALSSLLPTPLLPAAAHAMCPPVPWQRGPRAPHGHACTCSTVCWEAKGCLPLPSAWPQATGSSPQ